MMGICFVEEVVNQASYRVSESKKCLCDVQHNVGPWIY